MSGPISKALPGATPSGNVPKIDVAKPAGATQVDDTGETSDAYVGSTGGTKTEHQTIADRVAKGLGYIADPFIIGALINTAGSVLCHYAFGMPIDFRIIATFQAVGTTIGALYGPTKAWLQSKINDGDGD